MRFPQVAPGQRFTYQGKAYTKTGPLTASEEGSGQARMIPRSAEVQLLDTAVEPDRDRLSPEVRAQVDRSIGRFKSELVVRLSEMAAEDGGLQLEQVVRLIESHQPPA